MRVWLALLALCTAAQAADERPGDFPIAARIDVPGSGSHFRVRLPAAVYRATAQRGLGDLRIGNAAGEFVPFAFAPREPVRAAPQVQALKLFPVHGDETRTSLEGLTLRVERSRDGTVVRVDTGEAPGRKARRLLGYLVEVPELPRALQALALDWEAKEGFTGSVRVEVSDDLRRWEPAARAPVLRLEHAGERLERNRVDLPGARPKYLRLSFAGVPADFALTGATGELAPERPEPARESLAVSGVRDPAKVHEYVFDTGGSFPVERIRFELPQVNTIAPVQVFARERASDAWRPLATATVYRLSRESGEIASPDIALGPATERQWLLRVDTRAGGLGAGEVRLVVSWQPHEVVFAARGSGPFVLRVGNRTARGVALPIATVLPGFREGEPLAVAEARLGELAAVAPQAKKSDDPVAAAREFAATPEGRKQLLWGVIIAAVLLLAWMAMRLLREMGEAPKPPGEPR